MAISRCSRLSTTVLLAALAVAQIATFSTAARPIRLAPAQPAAARANGIIQHAAPVPSQSATAAPAHRHLQQANSCDASQGSDFLSSFLTNAVEGLVAAATDAIPGGFLIDALLDAVIPDGNDPQSSPSCNWQGIQAYVAQFVQQALDQNAAGNLASYFDGFQAVVQNLEPLNWNNTQKASDLAAVSINMALVQPLFFNTTTQAPALALPYLLPFLTLQLGIQQFMVTNYSLFYAPDAQNQAVMLQQLQQSIATAQAQVSSAVQLAVQQRGAAVDPNWGSKSCPGSDWTDVDYCSWNLIDNWSGLSYGQSSVLNAPASLPYYTPGQYPQEYTGMVQATTQAQLSALSASSALWSLLDPSQQWAVTNTTANVTSPLFGMWSTQTSSSLPTVQQQLTNTPGALIYTPSAATTTPINALRSITVYADATGAWQTDVTGVSFTWQLPSGPSTGLIGSNTPQTYTSTMTLAADEYVVSVSGVTAGLDGGVQFINFTTNLGNSLTAGTPYPGQSWNNQPGNDVSSFPVTPFFMDFSAQPTGAEVWLCGAYGFNPSNSVLSAFPSGAVGEVDCPADPYDWGICYDTFHWPALNTIGFNWCYYTYTVQPVSK